MPKRMATSCAIPTWSAGENLIDHLDSACMLNTGAYTYRQRRCNVTRLMLSSCSNERQHRHCTPYASRQRQMVH